MIVGLGIDIVELERLKRPYDRFGNAFLKKLLAPQELAEAPGNIMPWLGGRFAAKEAASKALGKGFACGISPRDFIISNAASGQPLLVFANAALHRTKELGVRKIHLSISHERHYAIAQVILED